MSPAGHFTPETFTFLKTLARNNRRDWFLEHKERYEEAVRGPALRFIADFSPLLTKISPQFAADPRPVGGSLFRINRDTRFAADKRPYKTHTGIQFRHRVGKDVHAPGFYLHIEPGNCFVGAGIWHPDGEALGKIRETIAARPAVWKRTRDDRRFSAAFDLSGDSLTRPPRGFDPDHPFIEDIKRKDFIAIAGLTEREICAPGFIRQFAGLCKVAGPFVRYLCSSVGIPF